MPRPAVMHALSEAQKLAFAPFAFQAARVMRDRGLLRAKSPGEQMQAVRDEFAFARALLRQPIGFEPAVIDFAKTCWAKFNPNAPQATAAASAAASWEEARKVVGHCLAALSQLSFGRSGSLPPNPAPAPDAVALQSAA